MIRFGKEICQNLDLAAGKEWVETNGIGGFASSTIAGMNTRRYHGLLVAATKPPVGRLVLLSKLEETIVINGRSYELSTNQYPGAVHPQGFHYLKAFQLDPFPVLTFELEGFVLKKSIFMIHGENSTIIQYEIVEPVDGKVEMELRPLIAFRDYHSTAHENTSLNPAIRLEKGLVAIEPYQGVPSLYLSHDANVAASEGQWYRNFEYVREKERGLDFQEDLFCPLRLIFNLSGKSQACVIASTEPHHSRHVEEHKQTEIKRRETVQAFFPYSTEDEFLRSLVAAADQFIVERGDQKTVIAGYHWFSDWGRDTMIAFPGLTLTTGRFDVARSILLEFSKHVDRGMLPNRFPDAGEQPEYNTVDATLWFFEAVRALGNATHDYEFIQSNLYEALKDIIDWHIRGTRYGIHMDSDALLSSGEPGVQLTWMDAKVGDWVVTPRHGKAVEIQALWYNALRVMEYFADLYADVDSKKRYRELASWAYENFQPLFWNESTGCLYDVVSGEEKDASIRPNQIFAVSLHYPVLSSERMKRVVETVEKNLLTPYGLRSLSPQDRQYIPRYEGDPRSRDGAYHQGTVWPWLMGAFLTAYVRAQGGSQDSRRQAAAWLEEFQRHFEEAGLSQISEIFDAASPHRPAGCIAQAWSVAEILRAAVEDVYQLKKTK